MDECPFCLRIVGGDVEWSGGDAVAFPDGFPITPGHTLVVPRVHCDDLFALPAATRRQVWDLVEVVREALAEQYAPDAFNIGANVGRAAGQTIGHAHVHVIPRFVGDVDDPRGGVRWVVPDRAAYWRTPGHE
jgi:diadenosine tetraphosphate (Ap4A) HIT family hydrolase